MKCEILKVKGTWKEIYQAALVTEGKETDKEPSSRWKERILRAEHSPIRKLIISARFTDIPYYVSTHLVRHKLGIEHWVRTQREDRTGIRRDSLNQTAPVTHEFEANAQAIINISRKRLCRLASPETREAWQMFINELAKVEPELADCCLPDCEYRGQCHEMKPCTSK